MVAKAEAEAEPAADRGPRGDRAEPGPDRGPAGRAGRAPSRPPPPSCASAPSSRPPPRWRRPAHEAEAMLDQAREQCRAMVEEAQGLRARVLADLSKRRKVLHAQIEQLRAGRERLAETVHDVRRSVDAIAERALRRRGQRPAGRRGRRPGGAGPNRRGHARGDGRPCCWPTRPRPRRAAVDSGPRRVPTAPAPGDEEVGRRPRPLAPEPTAGADRRTSVAPDPAPAGSAPAARRAASPTPVDELARPSPGRRPGPRPVNGRHRRPDGPGVTGHRGVLRRSGGGRRTRTSETDDGAEDDGPPEERHPLALRRDELIEPDRDHPGPPSEADPAGQPERSAGQPAVERLPVVDRSAARRDRAPRHATPRPPFPPSSRRRPPASSFAGRAGHRAQDRRAGGHRPRAG